MYRLEALMLRVVSSPALPANCSSPIGELAGLSPGYWFMGGYRGQNLALLLFGSISLLCFSVFLLCYSVCLLQLPSLLL